MEKEQDETVSHKTPGCGHEGVGIFFFFFRTPFALSSSNIRHSNVLPYCEVIEQEAKL